MYIQKNKVKDTTYFYLAKSVRDKGSKRPKTKVVERLGSHEELIKKHGDNLDKWLKDYAKSRTEEELKNKQEISIKQRKLNHNQIICKNIGWLVVKSVCEKVGLKKICKYIENKENFNFNLYDIVVTIICRDLLDTSLNKNLFHFSESLFGHKKIIEKNLTKAIKVLHKYNVYIQKNLYKNVSGKQNDCLIYDCSNYGFVGSYLERLKYNKRYSNNVTLGKVFMDKDLIPCGFILNNNLFDLKKDNKAILNHLKYKFKDACLYILPGNVESKTDSYIYRKFRKNKKLSFYYASSLIEEDNKFFMDLSDWENIKTSEKVDLEDLGNKIATKNLPQEVFYNICGSTYYKYKKIDNKYLWWLFNFEIQSWSRQTRDFYLKKFQQNVEDKLGSLNSKQIDQIEKKYNFLISDIVDKENKIRFFDDSYLRDDELYDGFCAMFEDIDVDMLKIISIALCRKYNIVSHCFEFYKPECVLDENLTLKESVIAHFLTSYLTYFVSRYLEFMLGDEYWHLEILEQLYDMNIVHLSDNVWVPTYRQTKLISKFSEIANLDINYNFVYEDRINN